MLYVVFDFCYKMVCRFVLCMNMRQKVIYLFHICKLSIFIMSFYFSAYLMQRKNAIVIGFVKSFWEIVGGVVKLRYICNMLRSADRIIQPIRAQFH